MRLKQVNIKRYGPINQLSLWLGQGVQPVLGGNESGKTLLVDALIKMLTGRGAGWDPSLDRVEESPEGFVVLEDEGNEIKLEKGETLADFLPIDARDFRNIFVVRDSDLTIPEEDVFYERVTDRITGLRCGDIRRIKEKLMELGRLTLEMKKISDSREHDKAASKLRDARELQKDIQDYMGEAKQKCIPDLEAEIFEAELREAELSDEISLLEKAEKRDNLLKLTGKLRDSKTLTEDMAKMPEEEKISLLSTRLEALKDEENIKPFFDRVKAISQRLSYFAFLSVAAVWIACLIFGPTGLLGLLAPLILLVMLGVLLIAWVWSSMKLSHIESERKQLISEARELGLTVRTIAEMKEGLSTLGIRRKQLVASLEQNIGVLKDALNIDKKTREEVLKEASEKLSKMKTTIDFGIDLEYDEDKLSKARGEVKKIQERVKQLQYTLTEHRKALNEFSSIAHKLNFRTFLGRELELEIENLESLELLTKEITEFADKIESDAYLCRISVEIFEEMEREEEAKISELFGEDSTTSKIFAEITGGRYGEVRYDHENKKILVIRPSIGQKLTARKLSKGAFDQLYLSIRIDLAQRMLEGRRAFFIMDDAFLSSDPRRLKEGMKLLNKLSDMGWQIVYFTVKAHDSEMLSNISGNKVIPLQPLP